MSEDGFFSRWSRRKTQAKTGEPLPEPTPVVPLPAAAVPLPALAPEVAPATEAAPQQPPLPTLDDVAALTPESDFKPFVARAVDPQVRNAAMKTLFSDPHFNVMDGLDIYIDDYSQPDPLPASMLRKMASAQFLKLVPEEAPARPAAAGAGGDTDPLPAGDTEVVAQSPDSSACADTTSHDHPDLQLQPDLAPADPQPGPGPR